MADLPTTVTLVAATPQTVTVNGVWSKLRILNLTASTTVFARGDGVTAAQAVDGNYAIPGGQLTGICIPTASTNGTTTAVSLISAGTPQVQVTFTDDDND